MHCWTMHIQIWGTVIPLLSAKVLIPECCNVSITTDTEIPPLSEILVLVKVSSAGPVDQLLDFVGYLASNLQNKCGCVVTHTVMSVRDEVTTASVLNPRALYSERVCTWGSFSWWMNMSHSAVETVTKWAAPCVTRGFARQSATESVIGCTKTPN